MLIEGILAASSAAAPAFSKVEVTLPASSALFPAGDGSSLADAQCLMCHSVEMVLQQPPQTQEQWTAVIKKMRDVYGAPVPEVQITPIARYLGGLSEPHRQSQKPGKAEK